MTRCCTATRPRPRRPSRTTGGTRADPRARTLQPRRGLRPEFRDEELERGLGLRLLFTVEVDAPAREEVPRLSGDRKRVGWRALRRQLEDARVVGIEPHLAD